jgi:hypothetical protein
VDAANVMEKGTYGATKDVKGAAALLERGCKLGESAVCGRAERLRAAN